MYERGCEHFQTTGCVGKAQAVSTIAGFEEHDSANYLLKYANTLQLNNMRQLERQIIVDRRVLRAKQAAAETLPADANMEDKVIQILLLL
ncbi:hypothetical protein BGZ99_009887 [Dissophora globulifera]|uniref:Uncharacterized protein n=1 Tax=Dissophora globulifera TaxID=979702 RepID=A0A9P6R3D0_9FUNG|nr:hypothetical protein BGZ99_009887 [Dissophora globulifera]